MPQLVDEIAHANFLPIFNLKDRTHRSQIQEIKEVCDVTLLELSAVTQLVDPDNQIGLEVIFVVSRVVTLEQKQSSHDDLARSCLPTAGLAASHSL